MNIKFKASPYSKNERVIYFLDCSIRLNLNKKNKTSEFMLLWTTASIPYILNRLINEGAAELDFIDSTYPLENPSQDPGYYTDSRKMFYEIYGRHVK